MAGFLPSIPKHLFEGIDIWTVTVGGASVTFDLKDGKRIMLQPYGMTEHRGDWLYSLPFAEARAFKAFVGRQSKASLSWSRIMRAFSFPRAACSTS